MSNDNNDNLYFLFKDASNNKDEKMFFEPKINNKEFDYENYVNNQFNQMKEEIFTKNQKNTKYDTTKLERRLISLLDTIEDLLRYLEDRRQSKENF